MLEPIELFCLWTKVHIIFLPNVEGVVVDQVFFRRSICRSVPEIFAIKVESQKSRRNVDFSFGRPKFFGAGLPKVVHALSSLPRSRSSETFREDTPTSLEVIEAHTLNFRLFFYNFHD